MMVFRQRHIWCCMDSFKTLEAIAILSAVFSFLQFSLRLVLFLINKNLDPPTTCCNILQDDEFWFNYLKLFALGTDFILNVFLFMGIVLKNQFMLLPWLTYRAILLLILMPLATFSFGIQTSKGNFRDLMEASALLFIVCFGLWAWVTVYLIFRYHFQLEVKRKIKKHENTRRLTEEEIRMCNFDYLKRILILR